MNEDSSTATVEACAEALWVGVGEGASCVVAIRGCTLETHDVRSECSAGGRAGISVERARPSFAAGVKGLLVVGLKIDTFNDINLACRNYSA